MDFREERKRRAKDEIRRQLKRYLRNAREKEQMVLTGFAHEYCRSTGLDPQLIEMVSCETDDGEIAFHFRRRAGALILPTRPT